jgi:TonB dependent receptor/Carboxypeptidase regulatory-like domain/TonB-dependent Receptor Plug Domain
MQLQKFRVALMLALVLLVGVSAFAQTNDSGAIAGTVKQGATALPGVTIEVRSPALQGVRTAVTDATGGFRFTLLPPGHYNLTATLSGFNPVTQNNVAVELNHTVTLEVALSTAASETLTVVGTAPVVDVTSNISGANITAETMRSLPIGRNFVAAAQVAPGTSADNAGTTVYGSSGAENEYIIDGLNTTSIGLGQQGKRLNPDFVQEVEVMTGGLPAEYGRLTGGAINAVTKSGSNELHGDVFGYDEGGSLFSKNSTAPRLPTTSTTVVDVNRRYDYGADLGGYFIKDRLWFYGAYDRVSEKDISTRINTALVAPGGFTVPVGGTLPSSLTRNLYAGKLSLALTSSQLFNFSVLGDPSTNSGAIFAIAGPPSTFNGEIKTGGDDYTGRYSGVFGTNWNINAEAGRHNETQKYGGAGTGIARVSDRTQVPNVLSGGFGLFQDQDYQRDIVKADVSAFFGSHQFKIGGDQEKIKAVNSNTESGGAFIFKRCTTALVNNTCTGTVYYTHEAYINDLSPSLNKNDSSTFSSNILNPLASSPEDTSTALYAQDQWKVLANFTLNVGLRLEQQKVGDRTGATAIDLKHNLSPRLGVIWDPANNGRTKVYANYGRFYENIPMDINFRAFGGELQLDSNNFDATPTNFVPAAVCSATVTTNCVPALSAGKPFRFLGGGTEPVDPKLKGQYIDEFLFGGDYEIAPNLAIGVKGTYRDLGNVIEDFLIGSTGEYLIANPGSGTGATGATFLGDVVKYGKAKRTYKGVEFHAQKRFSNNYQFFGSYVWSQLKGNYDGTFQSSTGQLDPNINSAFDYADFLVNNNGFLSNDRTHQVKFYGSYTFSNGMAKGLDLGVGAHWESGVPLTAQGYAVSYRNYEYYLTSRGALGRGPSDYEADLHAGYPIPVVGSRVSLLLDVFNVFNRQSATNVDQRYNLSSDPACAGIPSAATQCNGDGGLLNVSGTTNAAFHLSDARATATNPNFLKKGTAFTNPRSIRLGARWTF